MTRFLLCFTTLLLAICLSSCLRSMLNEKTQTHKSDQIHGADPSLPLNEQGLGHFGQPTNLKPQSQNTHQAKEPSMKKGTEPLIDTEALKENLENLKDDVKETIQTVALNAPETPATRKPTTETESLKDEYEGMKTNLQEKIETVANVVPQAAKIIGTEKLTEKLQNLKENIQQKVDLKNDHQPTLKKEGARNSEPLIDTSAIKGKLSDLKENIQEKVESVISNAPQAATFFPAATDTVQNISADKKAVDTNNENNKGQGFVDTDGLKAKVQEFKENAQETIQNVLHGSKSPSESVTHTGSAIPPLSIKDKQKSEVHKSENEADANAKNQDSDEENQSDGIKGKFQQLKEKLQEKIENIVHPFSSEDKENQQHQPSNVDEKKSLL